MEKGFQGKGDRMDWYQGLKNNNDTEMVNLGWVRRWRCKEYGETEIRSIKSLLKSCMETYYCRRLLKIYTHTHT